MQIWSTKFSLTDFIEDKLDNHTSSLQKVDDILEKSNSIEEMVDGINSTHQEIKGKELSIFNEIQLKNIYFYY